MVHQSGSLRSVAGHLGVAKWGHALVGDEASIVSRIEAVFWADCAQIQADSIGLIHLDEGAYLHIGSDEPVNQLVGIAKEEMAGSNMLHLN